MRTRDSQLIAVMALALAAAFAPAASAQEITAAITGKVSDPSGAGIAGASVTATDTERGTAFKTDTNAEGIYNLPRLPPGNYEMRVEAPGFQTAVHPPFRLEINYTARIPFSMVIGQVTQNLEVTAATPLLQTDTTQVGAVMESNSIANIPLETRNYNQLTLLVAGSVSISPAGFDTGQSTFNSSRANFNGNREQANYYLLDGVDNNEFVDNNVAYVPNVDAIDEMSIITNNPPAEFGLFLGGVINATTKSGTNSYHGDAFWFLRNNYFNANEWSNNFNGLPTPKQQWNQFGGTVGGPIKKDKLFFFADFQGSRFNLPATAQAETTFTAADATGNLTDLGTQLHYPGTNVPMPSNLNAATICGPGQTMGVDPCINGISPVALKIASILPKPNLVGQANGTLLNVDDVQGNYTHAYQGDIKIDWAPTQNDRIFARYTQMNTQTATTNSEALLYSGGPNSTGNNILPVQEAVLGYTRTLSPALVNDFRLGMMYYPADANTQALSTTAGANLIPGQPTQFLPGLYFAGAPLGGVQNGPYSWGTSNAPEIFHMSDIQVSDSLVWTKRSHTFHYGFQLIRYRNNYVPATTSDGESGQIGFTGSYTGNAEADFFLGLPAYMGYGLGFSGTVGQRNDAIGAFFEDDWRVTSKLTINYGLRWQLFTPIYEVGNRETNFNEVTGAIELAGVDGNSRALYNQYNGIANFLPRLGLAYSIDNKTVIRAAFSRSSFQEGTGEYNRLATNAPWNVDLAQTFSPGTNGAIPANQVYLDQGFAALGSSGAGCTVQNVTSAPAACFAGVRLHATDPNYRPAVSNQWNFTLQRQIGNSLTLQGGYVGQHTDHMAAIYDMGQNMLTSPTTSVPGFYLAGNPTLKLDDGTGQQRLNTTTAIQNYDALQLVAQQRLSKGLALGLNYSRGKCLTDNQGYYGRYGNSAIAQTTADVAFQSYVYNVRGLDYGLCDADVAEAFSGYLNYDLPFGHDRAFAKSTNKVVNAVIGDWRYDTVFSAHGGFPISMIQFGYDPTGAYFQPRPDCNEPSKATPYKNFVGGGYVWFDPTTMSIPTEGLGTCGISTERGPGLKQIDMRLSKQFHITERQRVQFAFDAINTFNTPIFGVNGYATDDVPGNFNPTLYNTDPNYAKSVPTGVVNTSAGARNLQFSLKYMF
jgi:hypothetical protein